MKTAKWKSLSLVFKVLTLAAALVTLTLFLFDFIKIANTDYSFTGLQVAFGSQQEVGGETVQWYKSSYYLLAFLLSGFTVVFSALNFKFKGSKFATMGFGLASAINVSVLFLAKSAKFDYRPLASLSNSQIDKQVFFLVAFIMAIAAFILAVVYMFVSDYAEVLESNGAKITIIQHIKRFFKDYKSEIKKIVWPSRQTVIKSTIVVLVMCAILGAYICIVDFGLAKLLELILGNR